MTLYRKHRPQTLADMVGQETVTTVLSQAISQDKAAHAYLFAGSRGTGKTSAARILAKSLNCLKRSQGLDSLPCNDCQHCHSINKGSFLDVLELDAASNRGIDEIRSLKEQVNLAPAMGGYKVYILDEVHMLTTEAFNALLKTLEEPPQHVVFVLCTTEVHKVPVTIASRCQRLVFQRASAEQLHQHLQALALAEHIDVDPPALALLAELADGSFRDAAMLLEQVVTQQAGQKIRREMLEAQFGLAQSQLVNNLAAMIVQGQADEAIAAVEGFAAQGGNVAYLTDRLIDQVRLVLYCRISPQTAKTLAEADRLAWAQQVAQQTSEHRLLNIARQLLQAQQAKSSGHATLPLELAIAQVAIGNADPARPSQQPTERAAASKAKTPASVDGSAEKASRPVGRAASAERSMPDAEQPAVTNASKQPAAAVEPQPVSGSQLQEQTEPDQASSRDQSADHSDGSAGSMATSGQAPPDLQQQWQQILETIRPKSRSVEALLRDCTPLSFDGTILLLQFWYVFHKKQLEMDKNRRLVESVASQVLGRPVKIRCQLGDKKQRPKKPMSEEDIRNVGQVEEVSLVDAATEIFGGELLD